VYEATSTAALTRLEGAHSGPLAGLAAPSTGHGVGMAWTFGADGSVCAWGMSEGVHDRLGRTREAVDAQHQTLGMLRSALPRASAAAAGRLEAATQRSEFLTRRMLDLEVSISVGGGAAGAATPAHLAREFEAGVDALNLAQREVAAEVDEALHDLRQRVDELIAFSKGAQQPRPKEPATVTK
jgi:hypothetical protein